MSITATHAPVRVSPSFREKIWGSTRLAPWFPDSQKNIGEVWFDLQDESFPILTKFIFTSERLSVQVHPNDEYAGKHENSRGKTEMWYILRADPGAQVAVGLREAISPERLAQARRAVKSSSCSTGWTCSPVIAFLPQPGRFMRSGEGSRSSRCSSIGCHLPPLRLRAPAGVASRTGCRSQRARPVSTAVAARRLSRLVSLFRHTGTGDGFTHALSARDAAAPPADRD